MRLTGPIIAPGLWILAGLAFTLLATPAGAGTYLSSAHGNATYGVNRQATADLEYSRANCAHCHEQHASIEGEQPAPVGGAPSAALLFSDPFTSQTNNFCLDCHTDSGSQQSAGYIVNHSYSYRAGGWTGDLISSISESFGFGPAPNGSSHNLSDIQTFITNKWGYNSNSNPCVACHNPHAAQGDPAGSPSGAKSTANRGWPLSRPSQHASSSWPLWGANEATERMNKYKYQAPYRYNSTTSFEPDGSSTEDGSNLADIVTFCTDCHNTTNTIYSNDLGRDLRKINWTGSDIGGLGADLHGPKKGRDAYSDKGTIKAPYDEGSALAYTLSCLDCHEPHGSPNAFLLREVVNGVQITVPINPTNDNGGWAQFCLACHNVTATGNGGPCGNTTAHGAPSWPLTKPCHNCHNHGMYQCVVGNSTF